MQSLFLRRALLYFCRYFTSPKQMAYQQQESLWKTKSMQPARQRSILTLKKSKEDILLKWSSDNFHRQSGWTTGPLLWCPPSTFRMYWFEYFWNSLNQTPWIKLLELERFQQQITFNSRWSVGEPMIAADSCSWLISVVFCCCSLSVSRFDKLCALKCLFFLPNQILFELP